MLPAKRHEYILSQIAEEGIVRIEDLGQALEVSIMTIHRDLDRLEQEGQLRKVRGGAMAISQAPANPNGCSTCRSHVPQRSQVILDFADGEQQQTCCPHCGLVAIARGRERVTSAIVTDFLFSQTINAKTATYLVEPDITICCKPTVLAFVNESDASRFQAGFGGQIMTMPQAASYVQQAMHLH